MVGILALPLLNYLFSGIITRKATPQEKRQDLQPAWLRPQKQTYLSSLAPTEKSRFLFYPCGMEAFQADSFPLKQGLFGEGFAPCDFTRKS